MTERPAPSGPAPEGKGAGDSPGGAAAVPTQPIPEPVPEYVQQVTRLIAAGKCKQAVELAKEEHKRRNTPESQRLLVDAYVSRIEQFRSKGAAEDARTLL